MKNYGRASVSDFLGDRMVYRNLQPVDPAIQPLDAIRKQLSLPPGQIPRKIDPDYARAVVHFLDQARCLDGITRPLQRLFFIGDTRMLDGTAFTNLCLAGGWPGIAFIGSENMQQSPAVEIVPEAADRDLYLSNRWSALSDFDHYCQEQGLPINEQAAVVVDLDKTAIGARGRNAAVIDQARLQAVEQTVAGLLGVAFDATAFRRAYATLNQPEFHAFTADNQDYLAYICLILGSGLHQLDGLVGKVRSGALSGFRHFIEETDRRTAELPIALAEVHHEIYANVQRGDPTPFKPFRRNEYLCTVGRMGSLPDDAPQQLMLAEEILVTHEVLALATTWRQRGALLFGLSDKPDEASLPTDEQARRGLQPIHRTSTHALGN